MERLLIFIVCATSLLVEPVTGRRGRHHGLAALYEEDGLFGCCFVDMFCYAACFGSGTYNTQALVDMARPSGLHTSDSRRHRHRHRQHRHRHGQTGFRVKRQTDDNVLWKKLRTGFRMNQIESAVKTNFPET